MNKPNIESEEDFQNYLAYLSRVAEEVDQWPEEEKSQRSTLFHADLVPQEDKTEPQILSEIEFTSKRDSQRVTSVDL